VPSLEKARNEGMRPILGCRLAASLGLPPFMPSTTTR
jgi:hypothetical protein